MRRHRVIPAVIILILSSGAGDAAGRWPYPRGAYLGQPPPGMIPEPFAPSLIGTGQDELNGVFSPDGKMFLYTVRDSAAGYSMRFTEVRNGRWTEPLPMPFFSGEDEVDMCFTLDGRMMLFASKRPDKPGLDPHPNYRLWKVERMEGMWTRPRLMGPPLNRMEMQLYPCLAQDGTLYFHGFDYSSEGGTDIYRSRFAYGRYQQPENLGAPVNSAYDESDACISPDERFIIFTIYDHPDGMGGGDLYISQRESDGKWTSPGNIGPPMNSPAMEYSPMITPDGRYLFFSTTRNGNSDIYWVDVRAVIR